MRVGKSASSRAVCIVATMAFAPIHVAAQAAPPPAAPAADVSESPEYRTAVAEAVQAFANQDWPAARIAFSRAHQLSPSARTCRGLGLSLFYLRDYVAARLAFEQALAEARKPLNSEQRAEIEHFLRSAQLETGRYELHVSPESAHVTIDSQPRAERTVVLGRGSHELIAEANGYASHRSTIVVSGGEDTKLEMTLDSLGPPELGAPSGVVETRLAISSGSGASPRDTHAGPRVYTWVALAAVPVFAGVGSAVWFTGKSKFDAISKQCQSEGCSKQEADDKREAAHLSRYETWSTVSFVAAGAAFAGAVALYFVEGRSDAREPHAQRKGPPLIAVGPTGVTVSGEF